MKKTLVSLTIALLLVPIAFATVDYKVFPKHLYLYEKDPSDWSIIEGGAWGRVNKGKVFVGHGLEPNTEYCLINYIDPWGSQNTILACGTTNNGGELHLQGDFAVSGKIWLVLDSDIDGSGYMTGWNPTEYLFEYDVLP